MAATGMAQAQTVPILYTVIVPTGEFGSAQFLQHVLRSLATAQAFCGSLDQQQYRADCLAERLETTAEEIPSGTDYDELRQVLQGASQQISSVVRQNQDRSLPRAPAAGGTQRTSRPLVANTVASQAQVNSQAIAIIDAARTQLLRSADSSRSRSLQYLQIAEALDSTKVLLRS